MRRYNGTAPAKASTYFTNLTYSPEIYGAEMERLVHRHADIHLASDSPSPSPPLFLYMAFQNNHAPYTIVEEYEDRYPHLDKGSMKLVYNSNMAATDDAVGRLVAALEARASVFGRKTLIVFSADNGGPASLPLPLMCLCRPPRLQAAPCSTI